MYDWGMGAFRATVLDVDDISAVEKAHVEDALLGSAVLDEVTFDLILSDVARSLPSDVPVHEALGKNERVREWVRLKSVIVKVSRWAGSNVFLGSTSLRIEHPLLRKHRRVEVAMQMDGRGLLEVVVTHLAMGAVLGTWMHEMGDPLPKENLSSVDCSGLQRTGASDIVRVSGITTRLTVMPNPAVRWVARSSVKSGHKRKVLRKRGMLVTCRTHLATQCLAAVRADAPIFASQHNRR